MTSAEIFSKADRLLKSNWKRHQIYFPPLETAYAYESPQVDGPHIWIDAGIHGDEIAPIHAVDQIVSTLQELQLLFNIVYCPLLNPLGFNNKTRYIETSNSTASGKSVGNQDYQISWVDQGQVIPPTNVPDNDYAFQLGNFVNDICLTKPFSIALDLHEDDRPLLPPGGYLYSMGNITPESESKALQIFTSQNIPLIENAFTRWGEPIKGIIKAPPNASLPELVVARSGPNCFALTVETTTSLPLIDRIRLHTAFVNHIPQLLNQE